VQWCGDIAHAALKKAGVFNWVPDGMVLSKLETGPNSQADAEIDARQAQMYNIAIQGPAITKTWCGDWRMQAQPMDKVFMLVVGDVAYTMVDPVIAKPLADACRRVTDRVAAIIGHMKGYAGNIKATPQFPRSEDDPTVRVVPPAMIENLTRIVDEFKGSAPEVALSGATPYMAAYNIFLQSAQAYETAYNVNRNGPNLPKLLKDANDAIRAFQAVTGLGESPDAANAQKSVQSTEFYAAQNKVRNGSFQVDDAQITNLRLKRATSSYLSTYSRYIPNKPESRCGLGIGAVLNPGDPDAGNPPHISSGAASYILGGWCIGTVLDSAASRSTVHGAVRSAPASMAMNVNVNVEWWSADKLHQHYNDPMSAWEGAGVLSRVDQSYRDGNGRGANVENPQGMETGGNYVRSSVIGPDADGNHTAWT